MKAVCLAKLATALTIAICGHLSGVARADPPVKTGSAATQAAEQRKGDPYYLTTCPVSGEKLGSMGDPVIRLYEGREIRFCCKSCIASFEKKRAALTTKLDETIIQDQLPLYPLKTSLISGKELPSKPTDHVWGNRLIRLCDAGELEQFNKDPIRFIKQLDKAVVAAQGKAYAVETCPISDKTLDVSSGRTRDVVLAGRLVRVCCGGCSKEVAQEPVKCIALVDGAREKSRADSLHKDADEKKSKD